MFERVLNTPLSRRLHKLEQTLQTLTSQQNDLQVVLKNLPIVLLRRQESFFTKSKVT